MYICNFLLHILLKHSHITIYIGDDDANLPAIVDYLLASDNGSQLSDAIKRSHPTINTHIKFDILMQYFNHYKIFTDDEMDHFNSAISIMEKVNKLISYLPRKDCEGNRKFVRALNDTKAHTGHCAILKELYNAVHENTAT